MDIYCPICAEPWDHDSLHEEAEARAAQAADNARYGAGFSKGTTYTDVARDFRRIGCRAMVNGFGVQRHCTPAAPEQREAAALVYEFMGDDMDAAAVFLEDTGLF